MRKNKEKEEQRQFDIMAEMVCWYLEKKGYKALVVGPISVAQRELKYKFQLIINFCGKKI